MELSYTQNLEDYHLWLAFAGQATGTYIDVGGGHPVADNVSFWFYERGWNGIVVEPQPELAALYKHLRPRDRVVRGLVGRASGEIDFYHVDRLHGFSTTVREHAEKAKQFGVSYATIRMPVMTLAELCATHHLATVDFLKVDVEGGEADVLLGNDWTRFRPKVIVIEAIAPGSNEPAWEAWEPFLLAQGYRFTLFDTLNRFYVAQEHPDILARAPRERASWDSARHMYEIGRAPENTLHPDHALARDLARGLWASLPDLEPELIETLLVRARRIGDPDEQAALAANVRSEAFRLSLGRIACGYDGGQIVDE
ncbi:MAG TPA: FkbM family methyltransferase [Xanthobacteraceae bacterium]|jgi:FkbM family methyltransferase